MEHHHQQQGSTPQQQQHRSSMFDDPSHSTGYSNDYSSSGNTASYWNSDPSNTESYVSSTEVMSTSQVTDKWPMAGNAFEQDYYHNGGGGSGEYHRQDYGTVDMTPNNPEKVNITPQATEMNYRSTLNRGLQCSSKRNRVKTSRAITSTTANGRRSILRPHSTPATLTWLEKNYELAEGVCIPRSVLYQHYVDFCGLNRVQPVNAASFGKIIRQQFPNLTTRRLGTRGQSRYHYYGIAIREDSPYFQLAYSKRGAQTQPGQDTSLRHKTSYHRHLNHAKVARQAKEMCHHDGNGYAAQFAQPNHFLGSSAPTPSLAESFGSSCEAGKVTKADQNETRKNDEAALVSTSETAIHSGGLNANIVPSLPPFPTIEELEMCQGLPQRNMVSTFLLMYRAHCQRILDAIVRANFSEVNTLVYHFWQQIPSHLRACLTTNVLGNLLSVCDVRLYRTIIKLLSVTFQQPLSESAYNQVEEFLTNFESITSAALQRYAREPNQQHSSNLHQVKLDLAHHFVAMVRCLLAHARLQHQLQRQTAATNCSTLRNAYQDLSRLYFETIGQQLMVKYCARLNTVAYASPRRRRFLAMLPRMLHNNCLELKYLLHNVTNIAQVIEWFRHLWDMSLHLYRMKQEDQPQAERDEEEGGERSAGSKTHRAINLQLEFAIEFLIIWTMLHARLVAELGSLKANASQEVVDCLGSLFEQSCSYKIYDIYFDCAIAGLLTNAAHDRPPSLMLLTDPLEIVRQTNESMITGSWSNQDKDGQPENNTSGDYEPSNGVVSYSSHPGYYGEPQQDNNLYAADYEMAPGGGAGAWSSAHGSSTPCYAQQPQNECYAPQRCSPVVAQTYGVATAALPGTTTMSNSGAPYANGHHHQQRQHRHQVAPGTTHPHHHQESSLICFSMNFHANSIQVMAPTVSTKVCTTAAALTLPAGLDNVSACQPTTSSCSAQAATTTTSSTSTQQHFQANCYHFNRMSATMTATRAQQPH